MEPINPLVAMKIAEYYPNKCTCLSIFDEDKGTFSAAICVFEEGIIGDTLYALDDYEYTTDAAAMDALAKNIGEAMDYVKRISN